MQPHAVHRFHARLRRLMNPAGNLTRHGVQASVRLLWALMALMVLVGASLGLVGTSQAQTAPASVLPMNEVLALTRAGAQVPAGARVEIIPGQLDPRLRLAPCQKIDAYLPPGSRPWGKTRVGLRCTSGSVAWNVYLPVTVQVWAPAVVTRTALAAGAELAAADLKLESVDIAETPSPVFTDTAQLIGRKLAQALPPGSTLRADSLRLRQWFAAGEMVQVSAQGAGFAVSSAAEALSPGLEGQLVRVRTESGRVLQVWPTGERQAEIRL